MCGTAIHRDKTREWAQALGFPAAAATAIAEANAATDGDDRRFPTRVYHMVHWLTGRDRRGEMTEKHLQLAKDAAKTGDCAAVWENLGYGLHALQDVVGHGNYRIHRARLDDHTVKLDGSPDPEGTRLQDLCQVTKEYLGRALADEYIVRCVEPSQPGEEQEKPPGDTDVQGAT